MSHLLYRISIWRSLCGGFQRFHRGGGQLSSKNHGCIPARCFEDPSVYPVIPHYEKNALGSEATVTLNKPPSQELLGDEEYNFIHDHGTLDKLDENIWSFLLLRDTSLFWNILKGVNNFDLKGLYRRQALRASQKSSLSLLVKMNQTRIKRSSLRLVESILSSPRGSLRRYATVARITNSQY